MLDVACSGWVGLATKLTQPHLPSCVNVLMDSQTRRSLERHRAELTVVLPWKEYHGLSFDIWEWTTAISDPEMKVWCENRDDNFCQLSILCLQSVFWNILRYSLNIKCTYRPCMASQLFCETETIQVRNIFSFLELINCSYAYCSRLKSTKLRLK